MLPSPLGRPKVGQIELLAGSSWLLFLTVILIAGFFFYNQYYLGPKDPKAVPLLAGAELMEQLQTEQLPVLVFFYHSPTGMAARTFFPIVNDLAERFGDKIRFYRYQVSPQYPDNYFNEFWRYDSVFALFRDAQEVKRAPVSIASARSVNQGLVFLVIKDWLGLRKFSAWNQEAAEAYQISADDFRPAVLASPNYVVVLFTSPSCPAARRFQPDFERVAKANGHLADFFVLDVSVPGNSRIQGRYVSRSTPTVALFYQGEVKGQFSGCFSDRNANESAILGLLVPHL